MLRARFWRLLAATAAAAASAQAAWPHCELRLVEEWNAVAVTPVDVDRDGASELHRLTPWQVTLMRQDGRYVWDMPNPGLALGWGPHVLARDVTGDGTAEFIATARCPESVFVYIQDLGTRAVRTVLVDTVRHEPGRDRAWAAHCLDCADLNGDGAPDLLVGVTSGYGLQPRGVYALDCRAGRRLWRFPMGANPEQVIATDVNGDSLPEVLVGTVSPGNGCAVNKTDDSHNYAVCLARGGNPLWIRELAEVGAGGEVRLAVADLDADGAVEVVVSDYSILEQAGPGRLSVLRAGDGSVLSTRAVTSGESGRVTFILAEDLDADGRPEVVTLDGAGRLALRDESLRVVRNAVPDLQVSAIEACGSLLGTETRQVAVVSENNELVLLDHRLRVLGSGGHVRPGDQVLPVATGPGRPVRLMVLRDWAMADEDHRPCIMYEFIVQHRPFPWFVASVLLGTGLLATVGITVYSRRAYRAQLRNMTRRLVQKYGVLELDGRGRVLAANNYARSLLKLGSVSPGSIVERLVQPEFAPVRETVERVLGKWEKEASCELAAESSGTSRSYLVKVLRVRPGRVFVTLEELSAVEYARRVAAWGPVAQRLAHGIKTPLSTIKLAAQRLEESGDAETGRVIREEVDRVSRMTDGFMRLTDFEPLSLVPGDLNRLVLRVASEHRPVLAQGIDLKLELADDLPRVLLDEELLARALANLVDNAISAMEGNGFLRIATRRSSDGSEVIVEVADSGPGIPEVYRSRLFLPFFTRKPGGTGLGLSIVRKTVEDHGGRVEVDCEAGQGATFRMVLPAEAGVA